MLRIRLPSLALTTALAVLWALWISACQFGGGTEDTNDLRISGRVLAGNGKPAPDAWVNLYPAASETPLDSTNTDPQGYFKFRAVPRGKYSLQGGLKSGAARAYLPFLELNATGTLILAPLVLENSAFLQGRIEGTWKEARAVLDATPYHSNVDSSGRFTFLSLAPGQYLLKIFAKPDTGTEREAARLTVVVKAGDSISLPPISVQLAMEWAHRARINIDTAQLGADVLRDFPLLIRLEGVAFPQGAGSAGQDIRIAGPDGSSLALDVESWDPASQKAAIWVRMDSLPDDGFLWMYWGNAAAVPNLPTTSHAGVFDSAVHAGVWHMGQSPSAAPPQMQDASGKVNPATVHGTLSPNPTAGIAGGALAFSGSDQFLFTAIPQVHPDAFTVSLWFRANGTNSAGKLIGLESDTTALSPYFDRHIWLDSMGHLGFGVYPPAPSVIDPADSSFLAVGGGSPSAPRQVFIQRILKSPAAYADGAWHQVAATLSPLGQCMYVDGTLVAANDTVTTGAGFTGYWRIGGGTLRNWVGAPGKEYFSGTLDEVTVALHARNKTWIHSAYLTQKPSATLITLAPEY